MDNTPHVNISDGKSTPTHLAQRCPVCNGFGTLKYGAKTCQACRGYGYILVPAKVMEDGMDGGSYGTNK